MLKKECAPFLSSVIIKIRYLKSDNPKKALIGNAAAADVTRKLEMPNYLNCFHKMIKNPFVNPLYEVNK